MNDTLAICNLNLTMRKLDILTTIYWFDRRLLGEKFGNMNGDGVGFYVRRLADGAR